MLLANVITSAVVAVSGALNIGMDSSGYFVLDDTASNGIRRVELIDSHQYAVLTGRLDRVWAMYHKTDSGRQSLHGKVVNTIIDEERRVKSELHADGYVHTEKMKPVTKSMRTVRRGIRNPPNRVKPGNMSARQWQKKLESENKKPKTVTVEFAPGGKPVKEIK